MGRGRALLLVMPFAVAACSGGAGGDPDAGPGNVDARWFVELHVDVRPHPGASITPLETRIDGELRSSLVRTFDDEAAWTSETLTFELVDGATVVDTFDLDVSSMLDTYPFCSFGEVLQRIDNGMCVYEHGEIHVRNLEVFHAEGAACGPRFDCTPTRCGPTGCETGQKCSVSYLSADRQYSRVECVASGARAVGESCTWQASPGGRVVDDCAAAAVCVDSVCRERCNLYDGNCAPPSTCVPLPRAYEGITACVPP